MDELYNTSSNSRFTNSRDISKRTKRRFLLKNDTVKFRNIKLISGGARGNIEGESVAGEDRVSDLQDKGFDVSLNGGEGEVCDFAACEREREVFEC